MRTMKLALLAPAFLYSAAALGQSGYVSPDGKSRYPGVTVFCPNGTGVTPCSFAGGGSGNGNVTVFLGGVAVGASNPLPVNDSLLDGLISGGALHVGGSVSITGTPGVNLSSALPAGSNTIGAVNLAAGSTGSVTAGGAGGTAAQAVQGIGGGVPLTVAGAVSQAGNWNVGVSSLPALAAGGNAIGSVSVSNLPATQPVSGSVAVAALPALPAGTNMIGNVGLAAGNVGSVTAGGTGGTLAQAMQGIAGGIALPVTGTFWQAMQPVSVASLPLPAGAALDTDLVAPYAPVAPAAATASKSLVIGCLSNTTLPSFTAGQEGAVPCDASGRPYVVTVPSANNVPEYLQAVSSGGATPVSAANTAASCMATNIKASSGMVYSYSVSNTNASGVWFRLFASATAPACGSATPVKRIFVPASATVGLSTDEGWVFTTGIGYDVTSGSGADTDTATVAAANSVLVNIDYK